MRFDGWREVIGRALASVRRGVAVVGRRDVWRDTIGRVLASVRRGVAVVGRRDGWRDTIGRVLASARRGVAVVERRDIWRGVIGRALASVRRGVAVAGRLGVGHDGVKWVAGVAAAGVIVVVFAMLVRPLLHAVWAETVTVDIGIRTAPTARARAVDDAVLASIESRTFSRELRQRLDRPARRVTLGAFQIDRCEVRQIDFERFAQWRQAQLQARQAKSRRAQAQRAQAKSKPSPTPSKQAQAKSSPSPPQPPSPAPPVAIDSALVSSSTGHRIAGRLQSPASGVTFDGAARYCAAVGGRLPWAEEVEAAATGVDGRLYPWGDTFDPGAWPHHDSWHNASRTCGAYPPSDTPQGVHDLAGNAMEWSGGSLADSPDVRQPAVHGAPAVRSRARALYALNAAWLTLAPSTRSHHLGFRCVYDAPPPATRPWGDAAGARVSIAAGVYPIGLPPDVRLARLAVILPDRQRDSLRARLADARLASPTITVGRCEISRREYQHFLNDPLAAAGLFANPQEPANATYAPLDWTRQRQALDRPIAGVSWWAADAFARWAGGRLPQAWEWQQLAAGPQARRYPWGDEYLAVAVSADRPLTAAASTTAGTGGGADPSAGNQLSDGDHPSAAGAEISQGPLPCADVDQHDVSAAGVHHLAGNVSEWTQSITVDQGAYAMWVQGGNWRLPGRETTRSAFGRLVPLNHRSAGIGVRIVYE